MQNAETVLGVLRGSLESPVPRNGHAGFGGRPHGKGPAERQAPRRAVDPTLSHGALTRVLATGAHVLWRARADIDLPVISVLDDGTYTSRVADPKTSRRLRREGKSGADIPGITVRVIEYAVTTDADTDVSELFCLVTDLLDPQQLSAPQAAQAYGQRWQIETAFAELETGIRGGPAVVLRSKSPDMIRQELYAMLCTYQAIRTLICHAAAAEGLDPDRISFTRAKEAIAARVTGAAAFSPR
jgi:Transposase DDE domain